MKRAVDLFFLRRESRELRRHLFGVHMFVKAYIILLLGNKDEAVVVDHVAVEVLG